MRSASRRPKRAAGGGNAGLKEFKQRTGLDFQGIDVLNVSVGTVRFIDLKDPRNNREQKIGIENFVNVAHQGSSLDAAGHRFTISPASSCLVAIDAGDDFFKSVFGLFGDTT